MSKDQPNQRERFERAARELETDNDEARFNERLKRIARESGKPKGDKADEGK